jgi:hypothetical protein
MAQSLAAGFQGMNQSHAHVAAPVAPPSIKPDEVMATLERLADLKAKGILTDEEFSAKKAELLKKLI